MAVVMAEPQTAGFMATCDRKALLRALQFVARVVPTRTPMPVLTAVKIEATDGRLLIEATDLELSARMEVPARILAGWTGAAVVSAKPLLTLLGKLTSQDVGIRSRDTTGVEVVGGNVRATVEGFATDQWPLIDWAKPDAEFSVHAIDRRFLTAFAAAALAAPDSYTGRPVLEAVACQDGACLATDGFRVVDAGHGCSFDGIELLVPARAAGMLARPELQGCELVTIERKIGCRVEEAVEIRVVTAAPESVTFINGPARLRVRTLEGTYPDIRSLLPKQYPVEIVLDQQELLDAMATAMTLVNSPDRLHAGRFGASDNGLQIKVRDPEIGEATIEVPASWSGPQWEIGFNLKMLREVVAAMPGPELRLGLSTEQSIMRIQTTGNRETVGYHMPLRQG